MGENIPYYPLLDTANTQRVLRRTAQTAADNSPQGKGGVRGGKRIPIGIRESSWSIHEVNGGGEKKGGREGGERFFLVERTPLNPNKRSESQSPFHPKGEPPLLARRESYLFGVDKID